MGQNGFNFAVTITAAATRQRVLTNDSSVYRFVPWAYFEAKTTNSGLVFLGAEDVAAALYSVALLGSGNDRSFNWNPFQYPPSPRASGSRNQNMLDLYNVWCDTATNGNILMVTVPRILIP